MSDPKVIPMSDLIDSLRDNRPRVGEDWPNYCHRVRPIMEAAAAHIETLEAHERIAAAIIERQNGQIAAVSLLSTPSEDGHPQP